MYGTFYLFIFKILETLAKLQALMRLRTTLFAYLYDRPSGDKEVQREREENVWLIGWDWLAGINWLAGWLAG